MAGQQLTWEPLQETRSALEEGECVYLQQDLFPIIGVVFRDTEADEERWEARLLANGRCSIFTRCKTVVEAKQRIEKLIAKTLKCCEKDTAVPIPREQRCDMQNILVFLLAIIEADEQILMVTQYQKVWVAIGYNAYDGVIQDYTMMFNSEGVPYCPEAVNFSGHYQASFSVRRRVRECTRQSRAISDT